MKNKEENSVHFIVAIIAIIITAIGTFFICSGTMKKLAANEEFWHEYSIRADKLIDAMFESDCDYLYDVTMEGQEYDDYIEYYEQVHKRTNK